MSKENISKSRNMVISSLFIALSMLLSYLETLFPVGITIPGFKLGLANIVILFVLYRYGLNQALIINILRVILISISFGSPFTFIYSIVGAINSTLVMGILKENSELFIVSIFGAITHNFSQLILAIFILNTDLTSFIPFLFVISIIMGYINSVIIKIILKNIPK